MKVISSYLDSHFNENFYIHEVGVKLIPDHHSKIKYRLESLEARAPAVSTIHLKFTSEEDEIKGELKICGMGKHFQSTTKGENPWEIYKILEQEIDKQLMEWKKSRFLNKYIHFPETKEEPQHLTGGYAV